MVLLMQFTSVPDCVELLTLCSLGLVSGWHKETLLEDNICKVKTLWNEIFFNYSL